MINFIICDSNNNTLNNTKNTINKIMNNDNYKIYAYNDYSSNLSQTIINEDINNKVYILDIELKNKSGIEIAKEIRKNDFNSIIIFYTAHEKIYDILKIPLIFDYVLKYESNKLEKTLENVLKYINNETLNINKNNVMYKIKYNDILYIITNIENRGVTIVTNTNKINVRMSMNEISKMLNNDFVKTHRACYVNTKRIFKIDFKNREIEFDNNEKINLVSIREIKKLKEKL